MTAASIHRVLIAAMALFAFVQGTMAQPSGTLFPGTATFVAQGKAEIQINVPAKTAAGSVTNLLLEFGADGTGIVPEPGMPLPKNVVFTVSSAAGSVSFPVTGDSKPLGDKLIALSRPSEKKSPGLYRLELMHKNAVQKPEIWTVQISNLPDGVRAIAAIRANGTFRSVTPAMACENTAVASATVLREAVTLRPLGPATIGIDAVGPITFERTRVRLEFGTDGSATTTGAPPALPDTAKFRIGFGTTSTTVGAAGESNIGVFKNKVVDLIRQDAVGAPGRYEFVIAHQGIIPEGERETWTIGMEGLRQGTRVIGAVLVEKAAFGSVEPSGRCKAPPSISISPRSVRAGAPVELTVTSVDFDLSKVGMKQVIFSPSQGIPKFEVIEPSSSSLKLRFNLDRGAQTGDRTITITTDSGSLPATFRIDPPPSISIKPDSFRAGESPTLTITSDGFDLTGVGSKQLTFSSLQGISKVDVIETSASNLRLALQTENSAATGLRQLTIKTAAGSVSADFNITTPPSISIEPNSVIAGAPPQTLTVTSAGFNLSAVSSKNLTFNPAQGISKFEVTEPSASSLKLWLTIARDAQAGRRTLIVKTASGAVSQDFNILPPSSISIEPDAVVAGNPATLVVNSTSLDVSKVEMKKNVTLDSMDGIQNLKLIDRSTGGFKLVFDVAAGTKAGRRELTVTIDKVTVNDSFEIRPQPTISLSRTRISPGERTTITVTATGLDLRKLTRDNLIFDPPAGISSDLSVSAQSERSASVTFSSAKGDKRLSVVINNIRSAAAAFQVRPPRGCSAGQQCCESDHNGDCIRCPRKVELCTDQLKPMCCDADLCSLTCPGDCTAVCK